MTLTISCQCTFKGLRMQIEIARQTYKKSVFPYVEPSLSIRAQSFQKVQIRLPKDIFDKIQNGYKQANVMPNIDLLEKNK